MKTTWKTVSIRYLKYTEKVAHPLGVLELVPTTTSLTGDNFHIADGLHRCQPRITLLGLSLHWKETHIQ